MSDIVTLAAQAPEIAEHTMILAQGVNEGPLEGFIREWGGAIRTWLSVILGIAGLIFIVMNLVKGAKAFSDDDKEGGVKHMALAAIVTIITLLGIGGLFAIIDAINPVDQEQGVTDFLQ